MSFFSVRAVTRLGLRCGVLATTGAIALLSGSLGSQAQGIDCGRLQAQIAQTGRGGGNYAKAARRQASELGRTQAYARQLGCDRGFSFFGGSQDPQCPGINARIAQMQANLGQLQASSGGGGREDLVARFNAYCRGAPQPPHERGFFESIFGSHDDPPPPPPQKHSAGGRRAGRTRRRSRRLPGGLRAHLRRRFLSNRSVDPPQRRQSQ